MLARRAITTTNTALTAFVKQQQQQQLRWQQPLAAAAVAPGCSGSSSSSSSSPSSTATATTTSSPLLMTKRFSHGPTFHDHSGAFSRPLTVSEKATLEEQKQRPVSAIVPGKMFMRHWIAGEQSTYSIMLRVVFIAASLFVSLYLGGGYFDYGFSSVSWINFSVAIIGVHAVVAQTHNRIFTAAFLASYAAFLFLF